MIRRLLLLLLLNGCAAAEQDIAEKSTHYLDSHAFGVRCVWPGLICRPATFLIPKAINR